MGDKLPTGDTLTTKRLRYRFYIPDELWLLDAFYGEILDAITSIVWEQEGAITPDEASQAMIDVYSTIAPDWVQVGVIVPFAGATSPSADLLPCDGSEYLISDYPELFSVIGFTYSSQQGATFNVPDLRGRAMIGVGTGSGLSQRTLGQSLGEESHVLSVGELAAHNHSTVPHSHTEIAATSILVNGGLEAPAASAIPSPSGTGLSGVDIGYSGGDNAHNNIQPSLVCNYLIVAR